MYFDFRLAIVGKNKVLPKEREVKHICNRGRVPYVESNCNDVVICTTPPDGRTDTDKAVVSLIAPLMWILRSRLGICTS